MFLYNVLLGHSRSKNFNRKTLRESCIILSILCVRMCPSQSPSDTLHGALSAPERFRCLRNWSTSSFVRVSIRRRRGARRDRPPFALFTVVHSVLRSVRNAWQLVNYLFILLVVCSGKSFRLFVCVCGAHFSGKLAGGGGFRLCCAA